MVCKYPYLLYITCLYLYLPIHLVITYTFTYIYQYRYQYRYNTNVLLIHTINYLNNIHYNPPNQSLEVLYELIKEESKQRILVIQISLTSQKYLEIPYPFYIPLYNTHIYCGRNCLIVYSMFLSNTRRDHLNNCTISI